MFWRRTGGHEGTVGKKVNEGGNGMPPYEEMLDKNEKLHLMAFLKGL